MKIRLSHQEVIQACAEYASKNTNYNTLESDIINTQYFVIEDNEGKQVEYNSVEFEYEA